MKKAVFTLLAAILLIWPVAAIAADVTVVEAEGTAARADDVAEVKKTAVEEALRAAVIKAARAILEKESLASTGHALETVASSARAYVLNYKIRSEGWVTHMDAAAQEGAAGTELYHIWIDASINAGALRPAVLKLASAGGTTGLVTIDILDVRDYKTFRLIFGAIEKVPFVRDLSYGSFANGRITLAASVAMDAPNLAARIAREVPEDFVVMEGAGQVVIRPAALVTR